ncbi:hypothetical protein G4E03_003462 [Salmonella enterica]|nr:hypothetical protein [Salmonella enterica]
MSDMYFDTDTFDFDTVIDVLDAKTGEAINKGVKLDEVTPDGGLVDDISDLSDLFENEEEAEREAVIAADPNNNVSDLVSPDDEKEVISIFEDLPEDAVFTIGGETLTKARIQELQKAEKQITNDREVVTQAAKTIDQVSRFIEQDYYRHQTAIDANIENIQKAMNSGVSETEYGKLSRQLNSAIEARNALNSRVDERMRLLDLQRAEQTRYDVHQADVHASRKIPNWEKIRGTVLADVAAMGVDLNKIEKIIDGPLFEVLYKASAHDRSIKKQSQLALEKAKAKAPRSQRATTTPQDSRDAKTQKQHQLIAKANNGGLSREENSQLFDFLVD